MQLFHGGSVLTMRAAAPRAEAVAIAGDRIVAVGDLAAVRAAAPSAVDVDLEGGCVLPGFIDAHHHFSEGAFFEGQVDLRWPAVRGVDDMLSGLMACAASVPAGRWVIGQGYDESRLRERRAPTLQELDAACPNHPVLLVQYSYHEGIVNTRAHEVLDLPVRRADPPGGEIEYDRRGRPTGRMIENALAPFQVRALADTVAQDEAAYFDRLARYEARLFAAGITRVHDAAVPPLMEHLLHRAVEQERLRLSVLMMRSSAAGTFLPPRDRLDGPPTGAGADPLRAGPLKIFLDGGERAALRLPVRMVLGSTMATLGQSLRMRSLDPIRIATMLPMRFDASSLSFRGGVQFYTDAEARSLIDAALGRNMTIAAHADGNEAVEQALRVLPRTPTDRPPGVPPHRIEHFLLSNPGAHTRAADLGVALAVQPTIVEWVGDRLLTMGVVGRLAVLPLRSLYDAGLTLAGSSDAPVVDFAPLRGIRNAVTRQTSSGVPIDDGEALSAYEALEMYTVHAARAGGQEQEVGTLEAGKRADLVVLSGDPTAMSPGALERVSIRRTVCGGVDVYAAPERRSTAA